MQVVFYVLFLLDGTNPAVKKKTAGHQAQALQQAKQPLIRNQRVSE
jgi:hypothetical protein